MFFPIEQSVEQNYTKFKLNTVLCGVRQGSVLATLIYNIDE